MSSEKHLIMKVGSEYQVGRYLKNTVEFFLKKKKKKAPWIIKSILCTSDLGSISLYVHFLSLGPILKIIKIGNLKILLRTIPILKHV